MQTLPPQSPPVAAALSPSSIKSGKWFRHRQKPQQPGTAGAVAKTLVGAGIGGVAYALGAVKLAIIIWVIAAVIGIVTIGSQSARSQVGRFFAALGRSLGWFLGVVLLTPVYLVGFTVVRVIGRLAGRDPLHLRDSTAQTFWLPADQDRRKVRHIRSLFATETLAPVRGWGVIAVTSCVALIITAEVVLRALGFGNPILYKHDVRAGYFPAPNQDVLRYGGRIIINSHGMRAPDFNAQKPDGTLRVFMLGDSTLWGGSFVDQPDIYARRLNASLDEAFGDGSVEILNIAANGWGPFNKLGYVESFGTFDSDVAVICLPFVDIHRELGLLTGLAFFSDTAPPRLALEEVLRHLNWRSRAMTRPRPTADELASRGARGIAAYVELAQRLRDSGCEVLIEILPSRTAGTTDSTPEDEQLAVDALRSALQEQGFTVGFPAGLFQGLAPTDELYRDPCHLRTRGHEIYAQYLESRLREHSAKFRAWAQDARTTADGGTASR